MSVVPMVVINCLFCNAQTPTSYPGGVFCRKCKTNYYRSSIGNEMIVSSFNVKINDRFTINYDLNHYYCVLYYINNNKWIEVLKESPIDKLLLTLPELRDKLNNLMAYI